MLRGFLAGLADHLAPGGEGWLILSDLAEHLGLRPREQLQCWSGSRPVACAWCSGTTCARATARRRMRPTRCMPRGRRK